MTRRTAFVTTIALAVVAGAGSAFAQVDPDEAALARMHADAGQRLAAESKFLEAAEEFEKGYAVSSDPELLFHIGEAYRGAGNLDRAAGSYRSFLDKAPASPNHAEAEKRLAEVNAAAARPVAPVVVPAPLPQAPPPAPQVHVAAAPVMVDRPAPDSSSNRLWLWVALGAVVTAGVVATGLVLSSRSTDEPVPGRSPPGIVVIR